MHPIQVFEKEPKDFVSSVQVAACYLKVEGKSLFLQYSDRKSEPGRWGVPAGKFEKNEAPIDAAKRELLEETGIDGSFATNFRLLGLLYMRRKEIDYHYHLFEVTFDLLPKVTLSDEHQNYLWMTKDDFETLPLMTGAKEGFLHYLNLSYLKPE